MTVLRRYLFFLLAMCTALAVGIAVGGGPLRGRLAADTSTVDSRTAALSDQVTTLRRGSLFDDAVTSATTQRLVRDRLAGHTVALLVLPRVSDATVADVGDVIAQAGATITVTAQVSADVINPAKKTYVESVADSSLKVATTYRRRLDRRPTSASVRWWRAPTSGTATTLSSTKRRPTSPLSCKGLG